MNTTELLKHPPMELTEEVMKVLNDRDMFRPMREVNEMIKVCVDNELHTAREILIYQFDINSNPKGTKHYYANKIFKTVEKYFKFNRYDNAKS